MNDRSACTRSHRGLGVYPPERNIFELTRAKVLIYNRWCRVIYSLNWMFSERKCFISGRCCSCNSIFHDHRIARAVSIYLLNNSLTKAIKENPSGFSFIALDQKT